MSTQFFSSVHLIPPIITLTGPTSKPDQCGLCLSLWFSSLVYCSCVIRCAKHRISSRMCFCELPLKGIQTVTTAIVLFRSEHFVSRYSYRASPSFLCVSQQQAIVLSIRGKKKHNNNNVLNILQSKRVIHLLLPKGKKCFVLSLEFFFFF